MSRSSIDVLVSTLENSRPLDLVSSMGITGGAVIVNQGVDEDDERTFDAGLRKLVETSDRGLSRSRNRAIRASDAEICLFADDDERLHPSYEIRCERAFEMFPSAGIIGFAVPHYDRVRNAMPRRSKVGPLGAMRLTSVQLAVRREVLLGRGVEFDERFGAGAPFDSGEEYILLRDALRAGIEIRAVPLEIAQLEDSQSESTWFRTIDSTYLVARGAIFRRADSRWHSALALQWVLRKRGDYDMSRRAAYSHLRAGSRLFAEGTRA